MSTLSALSLFATVALQQPAGRPPRDTIGDLREATARVTFDFGAGPTTPIPVRTLELGVANAGSALSPAPPGQSGGLSHVAFARKPGLYTTELALHSSSGDHIPMVTVEVLDPDLKVLMTLRLSDAFVASDRIRMNSSDSDLRQQRLTLEETIAELNGDLQEAQRQLNLAEALDKKRLSSTQEVARARERVEVLQTRLGVQRQRLALLRRATDARGPLDEEVVLAFTKFEIDAR
jgi:hypothetical protein